MRNELKKAGILALLAAMLSAHGFAAPSTVTLSFNAVSTGNGTVSNGAVSMTGPTGGNLSGSFSSITVRRNYDGAITLETGAATKTGVYAGVPAKIRLLPFANFLLGQNILNSLRFGFTSSLYQNISSFPKVLSGTLLNTRDALLVNSQYPMNFTSETLPVAMVLTVTSTTAASAVFYNLAGSQVLTANYSAAVAMASGKVVMKTTDLTGVWSTITLYCAGNNGCIISDKAQNYGLMALAPQETTTTLLSSNAANAWGGRLYKNNTHASQSPVDFVAFPDGAGTTLDIKEVSNLSAPQTYSSHSSIAITALNTPVAGLASATITISGTTSNGICALAQTLLFGSCVFPVPGNTSRGLTVILNAAPSLPAVATLTAPGSIMSITSNQTLRYTFKNLTMKPVSLAASGLSGVLSTSLSGVGGICSTTVAALGSCFVDVVVNGAVTNRGTQTLTLTYAGNKTLTSTLRFNLGNTSITAAPQSVAVGATVSASLIAHYTGHADVDVTNETSFDSRDPQYATNVDQVVTGVAAGSARLSYVWYGYSDNITVTVTGGSGLAAIYSTAGYNGVNLDWLNAFIGGAGAEALAAIMDPGLPVATRIAWGQFWFCGAFYTAYDYGWADRDYSDKIVYKDSGGSVIPHGNVTTLVNHPSNLGACVQFETRVDPSTIETVEITGLFGPDMTISSANKALLWNGVNSDNPIQEWITETTAGGIPENP